MAQSALFKALVSAQKAAQAVRKEKSNTYHNYRYASSEAIMIEAREVLNAHGLAASMVNWTVSRRENANRDIVTILFRLMHESGEYMETTAECYIVPEKGRPEDKALAASLTYAEGYYLRGVLCLPRVDESEEVDTRNDRDYDAKRPPIQQTHTPPTREDINAEIPAGPPADRREVERTQQFKDFLGRIEHLVSEGAYHSVDQAFTKLGPKAKSLGFGSRRDLFRCSDESVFEQLWQEINLVEETV